MALFYMELESKQSFDLAIRGIDLRAGWPSVVLNSKGEPATETWIKGESCPKCEGKYYCPIYDNTPAFDDLIAIESIKFLTKEDFEALS